MADTATGRATARRTLLAGAGLAAGAALVDAPADAATYAAHHAGPPLLSASARHLVGRFSYGVTPALARQVRQHGGADGWFEWQLNPTQIPDHDAQAIEKWFPHLGWSTPRIAAANASGMVGGWEVMVDYQNWLLLRRMNSERQVLE